MLQNRIYQNFIKEILKTFFVILLGLTLIAWTVRAVNFLDLIVESGYSISNYFQYSFLNLFGILTKFIPLAFLLSLIIFIVKQIQEKEFIILWTSGVKKIKIVNLFFLVSCFILILYLFFSTLITPLALNKSRSIISQNNFNSFLPTIRIQQFSDSFTGFTFLVEDKVDNEIKNIFIHDSSNILKNITSDQTKKNSTTIVAKEGIVEEKRMILFNGEILTSKDEPSKNDIIKFKQLNVDLKNLETDTIKVPKLQEQTSIALIKCLMMPDDEETEFCPNSAKEEITTVINRRFVLPFYIPIVSLLCSFLLINSKNKSILINKNSIFIYSFIVLVYSELIIRYTGVSKILSLLFVISPFILIPLFYFFLMFKLSKESI